MNGGFGPTINGPCEEGTAEGPRCVEDARARRASPLASASDGSVDSIAPAVQRVTTAAEFVRMGTANSGAAPRSGGRQSSQCGSADPDGLGGAPPIRIGSRV